ncbi:MAG: HIT domain-containing protein [Dokdonella sp.]
MAEPFVLDERLAGDCFVVTDLNLCQVLLMNDARYPWLVLVPRLHGLIELADLDRAGQHQLLDEIHRADAALRQLGPFDKLNVAALGNVVSQLHVHVIARRIGDDAWPAPVWDRGSTQAYEDAAQTLAQLRLALA